MELCTSCLLNELVNSKRTSSLHWDTHYANKFCGQAEVTELNHYGRFRELIREQSVKLLGSGIYIDGLLAITHDMF